MSKTEKALCICLIAALFIITLTIAFREFDFKDATLAYRDSYEYRILRQGLFPLLCSFLIMICSAVLMSLDAIRLINHRRTRGLIIIALFGLDAIFYSFIKTGIFNLFYGNHHFFHTLEEVSYILMPVFVTGFFLRGFKLHFPTKIRVIFYTSAAIALISLIVLSLNEKYINQIYDLNYVWRIVFISILMHMLFEWKRMSPDNRQILFDECALASLLISVISSATHYSFTDFDFLDIIQIATVSGYFVFVVLQHVQIMIAEYRYNERRRAKILKEQNLDLVILNREAEKAKQEAILANKTKSRFLANMSHEIRTPINAILGMDEIIIRDTKDSKIREYALDIQGAGRTLLSLINSILDFSKIESGKMEITPDNYDFSRLIMDLVNVISPRINSKGLELITEVDETIPRILYGDDLRLRQCITNILTNAVKYTEKGSVSLVVTSRTSDNKVTLHFEVSDTGMGIKEEDLPKLFHAYERIEESRNRNVEGTGLGMNITTELLALMGAHLNVSSVYGEGSTFSFDVEQEIIDPTPVGKSYLQHDIQSYNSHNYNTFVAPDAHILVTDDNAINRKVFIGLLTHHNMQIDEAESGFEAVEKAKTIKYDIIFMDHMMPIMDGIEAMKKIRSLADSPNSDTKIFVLTANAVSGAKEMYLEAGFDGFLSKPIVSDKMNDVLTSNLPEEKIIPVSGENNTDIPTDETAMPDELPIVDGIDWTFAWQHLPQTELLEKTIQQFHELIPVQASKLDKIFEHINEENMIDSYRIQVHGMKSLAATVGIIPLAGMAKILETAAINNRIDIIDKLHYIFIEEWNSYTEKLRGVMGIENIDSEVTELEEAKFRLTLARLEMLRQAMDDYDIDQADAIIHDLMMFIYPENIYPMITELKEAVADIDSDRVSELVDSVVKMGEW